MNDEITTPQNSLSKSNFGVEFKRLYSNHFIDVLEYGFIVAVWYFVFGRIWNADFIPLGGEYSRSISSFFFWDSVRQCGGCSFFGSSRL